MTKKTSGTQPGSAMAKVRENKLAHVRMPPEELAEKMKWTGVKSDRLKTILVSALVHGESFASIAERLNYDKHRVYIDLHRFLARDFDASRQKKEARGRALRLSAEEFKKRVALFAFTSHLTEPMLEALIVRGEALSEVAKQYGLKVNSVRSSVWDFLRRSDAKVKKPTKSMKHGLLSETEFAARCVLPSTRTPRTVEMLKAVLVQGKQRSSVAREYGVSRQAVHLAIEKFMSDTAVCEKKTVKE